MLEVMFESNDHLAKNAIPKAVKMVLANKAISFCLKPHTPVSRMMAVIVVNNLTALMAIFLRLLSRRVFFRKLLTTVLTIKYKTI